MAVFFILPLLLVGRMSVSDWSLLSGDRGFNFPENYTAIESNRLFWPAVVFTIQYTMLVTILLVGLGLGLALLVQEGSRYVGGLRTIFLLPVAVGLASASLLFWGFYSPSIGPIGPVLQQMGLTSEPDLVPGHATGRAALHDLPHRLEVRRPLHAHPARGLCRPSRGRSTRRPRSTVRAVPRRSAGSRCRCCGRRWRWRSSCA